MKNKIKKIIATITINLFIVVLVFGLTEYLVFLQHYNEMKKGCIKQHIDCYKDQKFSWKKPLNSDVPGIVDYDFFVREKGLRKPVGLNYKKKPIILFGCSFTYGMGLKDNQTLSYKLSELTKRPVYNRGYMGWGIQHMLYQVNRKDFYTDINIKEPEYIIYVFIPDHEKRLIQPLYDFFNGEPYLRYVEKNGKLQIADRPPTLFLRSYIAKAIIIPGAEKEYNKFNYQKYNQIFNLMEETFIESKNVLNQHFPNTKFVILKYYGADVPNSWFMKTERWHELEKKGFIIVDTKDLVGRVLNKPEDLCPDILHPSEKAWDLVTPKLVKKLNL